MVRQHHLKQLPIQALRPMLDLVEIEPRLEVEIVGAGAVLKVEVHEAVDGLPRRPLLSNIIAVCTAKVVTPAPPADGRKV
jgi:hypothetical protein